MAIGYLQEYAKQFVQHREVSDREIYEMANELWMRKGKDPLTNLEDMGKWVRSQLSTPSKQNLGIAGIDEIIEMCYTTSNKDAVKEYVKSKFSTPKPEVVKKEGWVSVKDRLPDFKEGFYECLVYYHSRLIRQAKFNCLTRRFQNMNFDDINISVTYWTELPSPPTDNKLHSGKLDSNPNAFR